MRNKLRRWIAKNYFYIDKPSVMIPDFTGDMNAALRVLQRMADNYLFCASCHSDMCGVYDTDAQDWVSLDEDGPMAICLAAYRVREGKEWD